MSQKALAVDPNNWKALASKADLASVMAVKPGVMPDDDDEIME